MRFRPLSQARENYLFLPGAHTPGFMLPPASRVATKSSCNQTHHQMDKHLVFVYGTLRSGSQGAISATFCAAKFIGDAKVRGSLYDLGKYPGLLLNESNAFVIGEVYEVDDDTLKTLDEFEASSDYWRQQADVFIGTNKSECWIYVPKANPELNPHHRPITSGDWIEYAKTKKERPGDP